ncbi:MAG TPA: aminoglycoside phosphotransferase family protein, partial [Streptosporangiaceae bacterium]
MEERLDGGNAGGAVRVGDTVRRARGPWTPAVHALLSHLAGKEFAGVPRPLGVDGRGREILTFLEGQTVGSVLPWPGWA